MRTRTNPLATRLAPALLAAAGLCTAGGCVMGPHDGQITDSAFGTSLTFNGVYDSPGIDIELQVLDSPDGAHPAWAHVVTVQTSQTPKYFPSSFATPYYEWSATATPAANDATGKERWPTGGLLRVRAVAHDPNGHGQSFVLDVTDEDQDACYGAHQNDTWIQLVMDCGKDPAYGAAIADTSVSPADNAAPPRYLTRKAYTVPAAETQALNTLLYYQRVGMPTSLGDFKKQFGFNDGSGNPVAAKYYNYGDLGIGRDMHCAVKNGTTACYVSNFAPKTGGAVQFGDENGALGLLTTAGSTPFATVAMTFRPPISDADSVKFVVYDAGGAWQYDAQLDSHGFNTEVPGNCLSCHGGSTSYDPAAHSVGAGAHFLPFDVFNSLHFSTQSGYSYADQAEQLRKLNVMVMNAGATPAIKEYIQGLYQGTPTVANSAADAGFVPAKWSDSDAHKKLYTSVVAPYCRTCHVSNFTGANLTTALDFSTFDGFKAFAGSIHADVCAPGGHVMPHAEQTLRNFWASPARAHLTGGLGFYSSCSPQ